MKIIEGGPASRNTGLRSSTIGSLQSTLNPLWALTSPKQSNSSEGKREQLSPLLCSSSTNDEEKLEIEIIRGEVVIKEARIESRSSPLAMVSSPISPYMPFIKTLNIPLPIFRRDRKNTERVLSKGVILDLRFNAGGVLPRQLL